MIMSTPPDGRLNGPVHGFFGLSYANYAVIHRTLMQSMPEAWQQRMVTCLRELDEAFAHVERAPGYDVTAGSWLPAGDSGDDDLKAAGARQYWVNGDGETIPDSALDDDEVYATAERRYEWRGEEYTDQERIFLPYPGGDPVPHYSRGRTFVEPKLPELVQPTGAAVSYVPVVDRNGEEVWLDATGAVGWLAAGSDGASMGRRRLYVQQPAEPDLIDGEGDVWTWDGEGYRLRRDPGSPAYTRAEVEEDFGPVREAEGASS